MKRKIDREFGENMNKFMRSRASTVVLIVLIFILIIFISSIKK
ncbi:MAG: succinate dehydrogenase hydrophobic anchor subunit [Candidatus Paceibacteria bacterium]|jgi:succinate dehydrogenase hydrophobic anchor subunit